MYLDLNSFSLYRFFNCIFVGWQGPDCTLDVDECDYASPCGSHGNCTNLNGSYECACEPEYTGIMVFVSERVSKLVSVPEQIKIFS